MDFDKFIAYNIFSNKYIVVTPSEIIYSVLIFVVATVLMVTIRHLLRRQKNNRYHQPLMRNISTIMILSVFVLQCNVFLRKFDKVFETALFKLGSAKVSLSVIVITLFILLFTNLIIKISRRLLDLYSEKGKIEKGISGSIFSFLRYVFWVIAITLMLDSMGINLTIFMAGSAALLVGLGLGVQQIFKDIVSGIFLLFERSLKVSDIVEIDKYVGEVKEIGIRTSTIITRDNIKMIIPNSRFISDSVINWSHIEDTVRFYVSVGVAYGSDVDLVKNVLLNVAREHPDIINTDHSFVRFTDFGDSSLNFRLYFWTRRIFTNEDIKSDLRFMIDREFRANNITIPFPQRDLHIKSGELLSLLAHANKIEAVKENE